ncbi:MAG: hypothetical protein J6U54_11215 [Clostridiales bacterium]|nr:hypothetical protein [Clostridiales bacterium]
MRKKILRWVASKITIGDVIYVMSKIMKRDRVKVVEFDVTSGSKTMTGKAYWIKKERA